VYFGASTGAAAALQGTARKPDGVAAVVSRGGRPEQPGALEKVAEVTRDWFLKYFVPSA